MDKKVILEKTSRGVKARMAPIGSSGNGQVPIPGTESSIKYSQGKLRELSGLIQRAQLGSLAGLQYGGERNLYSVFGYKPNPSQDDYLAKYVRQDITTRIIDAPPLATWSNPPEIEQEAIKAQWDALDHQVKLWPGIYRADRLARLNNFSLLLLGYDDSGKLERKVSEKKVKDLLYIRAIPARLVDEITFIKDPRDPRFGFPEVYSVQFDDPKTKTASQGHIKVKGIKDMKIHHSRVVHIVENALEDQVFGIPIIEKVYNLLDDLLKVAGGTSETYWLTGNRGMQADIDPEMELSPDDAAALSDELDEYMHQLRRIIRTRGVELNTLESKPPSPKEVFNMIIAMISGTTGIPQRILIGSEAGQLASEQDRANWAERIEERRALFAEPNILEPLVGKLQATGLLGEGKVSFKWPTAFIQNPLEIGQTQAQTARAIGNISRQTGNKAPMQIISRQEARDTLGFDGELAEEDIIKPPEEPPRPDPNALPDAIPGSEDESTGADTKSKGETKPDDST